MTARSRQVKEAGRWLRQAGGGGQWGSATSERAPGMPSCSCPAQARRALRTQRAARGAAAASSIYVLSSCTTTAAARDQIPCRHVHAYTPHRASNERANRQQPK